MPISQTANDIPAAAVRLTYDLNRSMSDNAERGPLLQGPLLPRRWPPRARWYEFLGHKIASRIGVGAGLVLNAKWVAFASQLGFDVITYHTIRGKISTGYPSPNIFFVDAEADGAGGIARATQRIKPPTDLSQMAIARSMGLPCREPEFLHEDIQAARELLHDGQILVVSIAGAGASLGEVVADFVSAARIAKRSGAHAVEADFSSVEPQQIPIVAGHIVSAIGTLPLIARLNGPAVDQEHVRDLLIALAKAGVRGVSGIHSVPIELIKENGTPALPGRSPVLLSGAPIRPLGIAFVQKAREIITTERLDLVLVGCGGIVRPDHFDTYLRAGADITMTSTGILWDPYLAMRWHQSYPSELGSGIYFGLRGSKSSDNELMQ